MEVLKSVRETAQRLLRVKDGEFERTPGRRLIDITDDLLIEIRKAVTDAGDAAQPNKLTVAAKKQVMLWVVVDTVRSQVVLSRADIVRVADRIWVQAGRVSQKLGLAAQEYASECANACAAAASDPGLAAELAKKLAAITAAEDNRCDKVLRDVFQNLYELAAVPDAAPIPAPLTGIDPPKSHDPAIPTPSSTGIRYPWLILGSAEPAEAPAIPADLLDSLEPDAVQRLLSCPTGPRSGSQHPEHWWSLHLPSLVNRLVRELATATTEIACAREQERIAREWGDAAIDEQYETRHECDKELLVLETENDELRRELERSEAKVEVLSEVLSRKNA